MNWHRHALDLHVFSTREFLKELTLRTLYLMSAYVCFVLYLRVDWFYRFDLKDGFFSGLCVYSWQGLVVHRCARAFVTTFKSDFTWTDDTVCSFTWRLRPQRTPMAFVYEWTCEAVENDACRQRPQHDTIQHAFQLDTVQQYDTILSGVLSNTKQCTLSNTLVEWYPHISARPDITVLIEWA